MCYKFCVICGKKFYKNSSDSKRYWVIKKYCSRKCFAKSRFGSIGYWFNKKRSKIDRIKMSLSRIGINIKQNHPNWKGGLPKCRICGKDLKCYDSKICLDCRYETQRGRGSHFWKGGITPLYNSIRGLDKNKLWIKSVFEKDNYVCVDCGYSKGKIITAHHNIKFSTILKNFLQTYSQFSPIEDKETLIRLAENHKPFWDVNNGMTLCKNCHKKHHLEYAGLF